MKNLAIVGLLLVSISMHAQISAREVADKCKALNIASEDVRDDRLIDHAINVGFCNGYLQGVVGTLITWDAVGDKVHFKMLDPYTYHDLADALLADLHEHPEDNPQPASLMIIKAAREHKMIEVVAATKTKER